jgi:hypothetical protein
VVIAITVQSFCGSRYLLAEMEELIIIAYGISCDHKISTCLSLSITFALVLDLANDKI